MGGCSPASDSAKEAVFDPQVVANDFVVELDHPTFGPYTTSGMPLSMEKARCEVRGPSPRLAEHTVDVMAEVGLDPQTVQDLLAAGTVVDGSGTGDDADAEEQRGPG